MRRCAIRRALPRWREEPHVCLQGFKCINLDLDRVKENNSNEISVNGAIWYSELGYRYNLSIFFMRFTAIILVNTNIGFCFSDEKAYTHILIIAQSFGEYRHKILFLR